MKPRTLIWACIGIAMASPAIPLTLDMLQLTLAWLHRKLDQRGNNDASSSSNTS